MSQRSQQGAAASIRERLRADQVDNDIDHGLYQRQRADAAHSRQRDKNAPARKEQVTGMSGVNQGLCQQPAEEHKEQ
ncbi:hypothetical protein [Erwinia aphidicola]|uniref:hypothetical protein n=1 Tax=Erwinia aphidicola TaxID=68334 RepID=UPI0030183BD4